MPNPPEKLNDAKVRIERAKQHIADVDRALRAFFETTPYKISANADPNARKVSYYLSKVDPVPAGISDLTGEAIQSLRTSLDYLAYELVRVGTNANPADHVYFPISDSATKYVTSSAGKVKGANPLAIKAIDAIQPYQGGNGHQLWVLHKLNNISKHRRLLIVGSAFRSFNIGAYAIAQLESSRAARGENAPLPKLDFFLSPADRMCPLKTGDELFADLTKTEVDNHVQFRFDVSLAETETPNGQPLLELLNHFAGLVDGIRTQFIPFV